MYNLIICVKSPETNFVLGFKEEGTAKAELVKIRNGVERVTVKDDYGHEFDIEPSNIGGVLLQSQQGVMDLNADQNIDKARANDAFAERRKNDMELMRLFPSNMNPMGRA